MKVKIKTLTPIHIGTGKKLTSMEFFNNYRINYDKLFDFVAEQKKDDFFNWLEQNPTISANEIQTKFAIKQKDIIDKTSLYRLQGIFQRDLNEGIKDSENKLFVPGSSLKGAIRTALMYKVLKDKSHNTYLLNFLDKLIKKANIIKNDNRKIKSFLKEADDELEEKIFICGVQKEKNGKLEILYNDQKYDLLKIISVTDSSSLETDKNGEISELQVYALKKTIPHKSFKVYSESISSNSELIFDIRVDVSFLKKAKEELNQTKSDFGKKYYVDIEQKLKNLFDIDIKNDNDFDEKKIINTILNALADFGNAISQIESQWASSIKNKGNANFSNLDKVYKDNDKFKIGFATGFSGMTILPLLLSDNNLKQKAFEFYKTVGIGFHNSTRTPLNINEFPFTRKYENNQNVFQAFGWVKIINNGGIESSIDESQEEKKIERPANTVIAEIIDDKSKPPKVKILDGEHSNKETILPNVRLEGLGLSQGSKVYVKLIFDKKILQKAEFKGKI